MKQTMIFLLLVAAITAIGFGANTQTVVRSVSAFTIRNGGDSIVARDTLKNADVSSLGRAVNYKYDLTFEYKLKRLTGYIKGSVKLKGTDDSLHGPWYTVRGTQINCANCIDSMLTLSNVATNTGTWQVKESPFRYYKMTTTLVDSVQTAVDSMTLWYQY